MSSSRVIIDVFYAANMKKPDHCIVLCLFLCTSQENIVKAINAACDSLLLILEQGNKSTFLNPACLGPGRHSDGLLCCLNARWHTLTFVLFLKTCSVISIKAITPQAAGVSSHMSSHSGVFHTWSGGKAVISGGVLAKASTVVTAVVLIGIFFMLLVSVLQSL